MNEDTKKKAEKTLSETLRKVVSLGIGAAFMTEDAVKNLMQDLPLPKDIGRGVLEHIKGQKNELVKSVKAEVKNYLLSIDPSKEINKILANYEIKVDAKLAFQRKKKDKD